MKTENRKDWQADPEQITTEMVTLWSASGIMLSAKITQEKARDLVSRGKAFIASDGHIGMCESE